MHAALFLKWRHLYEREFPGPVVARLNRPELLQQRGVGRATVVAHVEAEAALPAAVQVVPGKERGKVPSWRKHLSKGWSVASTAAILTTTKHTDLPETDTLSVKRVTNVQHERYHGVLISTGLGIDVVSARR